jgi:hypothetical protein
MEINTQACRGNRQSALEARAGRSFHPLTFRACGFGSDGWRQSGSLASFSAGFHFFGGFKRSIVLPASLNFPADTSVRSFGNSVIRVSLFQFQAVIIALASTVLCP